ncbi:MAG: hypothetical protein P8Y61_09290 [Gammaproteobacteria bacterium]
MATPALAASWDWGSSVALNAAWADNPALVNESRNPSSTFRMVAVYNGDIVRLTPSSTLQIDPKITRDYYPDSKQKDLESTDIFLPGRYRVQGPRTSSFLGWNLSRQNVLSDESTVSEDTGIVNPELNADDTVYRASLSPGIAWIINQTDQVFVNFTVFATKYDLPFTNRADSIGGLGSFSYTKGFSQRQSLGFSASYNQLKSDNTSFRTFFLDPVTPTVVLTERITNASSTSFTVDYTYQLSNTSALSLKAGLQSSTSEIESTIIGTDPPIGLPAFEQTFKSSTYDIIYRKTLRRGDYSLNASRRVSANVAGQPQDRYDLAFRGNLDWTSKLSTDWVFRAWQQQNIIAADAGIQGGKTRYFGADLRFNWQYTQRWSFSGRYSYQYRERPDQIFNNVTQGGTAQSNRVSLGFNYRFKRFQRR